VNLICRFRAERGKAHSDAANLHSFCRIAKGSVSSGQTVRN